MNPTPIERLSQSAEPDMLCTAVTKGGRRCSKNAFIDGFCKIHRSTNKQPPPALARVLQPVGEPTGTTALATVESPISVGEPAGVHITKSGLKFSRDISIEDWTALGKKLKTIEGSLQWWIGDWLNYGERVYGENYTEAEKATGFDYQSLANMKWVASKFEFSRRRENLSWRHHAEVAAQGPEEQNRLLDWAEENKASAKFLRTIIRSGKLRHEPSAKEAELRAWIKRECPGVYAVVQGSQYDVQARSMRGGDAAFDLHLRGISFEAVRAACLGGKAEKENVSAEEVRKEINQRNPPASVTPESQPTSTSSPRPVACTCPDCRQPFHSKGQLRKHGQTEHHIPSTGIADFLRRAAGESHLPVVVEETQLKPVSVSWKDPFEIEITPKNINDTRCLSMAQERLKFAWAKVELLTDAANNPNWTAERNEIVEALGVYRQAFRGFVKFSSDVAEFIEKNLVERSAA